MSSLRSHILCFGSSTLELFFFLGWMSIPPFPKSSWKRRYRRHALKEKVLAQYFAHNLNSKSLAKPCPSTFFAAKTLLQYLSFHEDFVIGSVLDPVYLLREQWIEIMGRSNTGSWHEWTEHQGCLGKGLSAPRSPRCSVHSCQGLVEYRDFARPKALQLPQ